MRFALLEAQMILATLAQSFSVRLKPGHEVVPEARLNLPPRYGIQMFLESRRRAMRASV
jgi:cytochrome P450